MTGKVGFRPSLDLSYIKFIAQMFFYFLRIWFAETLSDVLITVTSTAATKTTPRSQSSSKLSAQVPCSSARIGSVDNRTQEKESFLTNKGKNAYLE